MDQHPPQSAGAGRPALGMLLKGYPRISETFISNEIFLLERLGFNIHIFSMRRPRESFSHDSVKKIRAKVDYLPDSILLYLPRLAFHNLLLAARRPRAYLGAVRLALKRFARTHKSATIKHLLQAGYLVHHLWPGSRVNHIHAHFAHSPTSVALFVNKLTGLPFSFTAHAKDIYTSDKRQLAEKIALARFVVTCTEYNRNYLASLIDGVATPLHRVYHGIDLSLFSGEPQGVTPRPPYKILTVARLTTKKGLPTVYQALARLRDQGCSFQHTLIGNGEEADTIMALIDRLGLSGLTRWLGTQPHHVVLEHYRRSDLFVLGCEVAADGDRDGIPNVLVESMAMGVPVVATWISAIPELVENEKTGLLSPPRDPEQLASAMFRLLTDIDLRARIIPRARARVLKDFDNKRLIGELARIYRSTAGPGPESDGSG